MAAAFQWQMMPKLTKSATGQPNFTLASAVGSADAVLASLREKPSVRVGAMNAWVSGRKSRISTGNGRPSFRRKLAKKVCAARAGFGEDDTVEMHVIHGKCFVVGDNIDTDQIIPAEYLTLVPSKPEEYEKLGTYAMIGLSPAYGQFIQEGKSKTEYSVVIAGSNFGCGSSREHAPVALGAAGVRAVVAESYARIFFRNSVATGELYPVESEAEIHQENRTGDLVTVDLGNSVLVNHTSGKQFALKPIGDAGPVIDAGGLFAYARKTGMIAA